MATVHIREIQKWLRSVGQPQGEPGPGGMFLEIVFAEAGHDAVVDDEMRNVVITAEAPQGSIVITFDDSGLLKSIDIS